MVREEQENFRDIEENIESLREFKFLEVVSLKGVFEFKQVLFSDLLR